MASFLFRDIFISLNRTIKESYKGKGEIIMLKKMMSMMVVVMSVATMGTVANERTDDIWKNCSYEEAMKIHQDIAELQESDPENKWYAYVEGDHLWYCCDYTDEHKGAKEYGWY